MICRGRGGREEGTRLGGRSAAASRCPRLGGESSDASAPRAVPRESAESFCPRFLSVVVLIYSSCAPRPQLSLFAASEAEAEGGGRGGGYLSSSMPSFSPRHHFAEHRWAVEIIIFFCVRYSFSSTLRPCFSSGSQFGYYDTI